MWLTEPETLQSPFFSKEEALEAVNTSIEGYTAEVSELQEKAKKEKNMTQRVALTKQAAAVQQQLDVLNEVSEILGGGENQFDRQGNPIDVNGDLIAEPINSIDDITDEDFTEPYRNIQLPPIPQNVDDALGANGKPVVIKKNIFERNLIRHSDLTPQQSRNILRSALYSPNLYGQNQKKKKPYNWVVVSVADTNGQNRLVLLEISDKKDNVEIVHWHFVDNRGLEKLKKQAEREDGQLLILPSENSEEVGALSNPTLSINSSESKNTTSVPNMQEVGQKNVGLVQDDFTVTLPKGEAELIDSLARSLGLSVEFVDKVNEGNSNAQILGNKVLIAKKNRDKAIKFLVGHEFTHRMQDLSPEAYAEFKAAVKEYMGEELYNTLLQKEIAKYRQHNIYRTQEQLEDEVIADFAGSLAFETDVLDTFIAAHADKKSMWQAILDVLRAIREWILKDTAYETAEARALQNTIGKLETLFQTASEKVAEGATEQNTEARRSLKEQVADILDEYNAEGVQYSTPRDVADALEGVIAEASEGTSALENILADFRNAQDDSRSWGERWDSGGEEAFIEALQLWNSQQSVPFKETDNQGKERYSLVSEQIETLFNEAVAGNLRGKPISIGTLTPEGKEYLEQISGLKLRDRVDFVLNPSDLRHIYNEHYGENEKDKGNNIPLNTHDIRRIIDVISFPDKIVYGVDKKGIKCFFFLMGSPEGTYNLLEVYSDGKGTMNSKTYYKTKKGVSQRVISLIDSLHSTPEADGATLSNAKIQQIFELPKVEPRNSLKEADNLYLDAVARGDMAMAEEQSIIATAKANGTYLKAPNGADTNLTPKQWVMVRTKAFKDWFGNWEMASVAEYLMSDDVVAILNGDEFAKDGTPLTEKVVKYYADNYDGKVIRNGLGEVLLDKRSVKDSASHGLSKAKSAAFAAVPNIITEGRIIDSQTNWKGRGYDSVTIAAPIRIGDENYVGVVVVKKSKEFNRFYLHEVMIQKSLRDGVFQTSLNTGNPSGDIAKVIKNIINANNSSKIVDANSEPKVVEHSTWNEDFYTFDINRLGESSGDEGVYGAGFYFGNVGETELYGDRAIQAYLNMRNPLVLPDAPIRGFFDYLVENFDKEGLRDIVVKQGNKATTMGDVVDAIKAVNEAHARGEYAELIEQMSQYWYPAEDRVLEQKIFRKIGLAIYPTLEPFIQYNVGRKEFSEALRNAGYDGVVYDNREYVAFEPNQIKSADTVTYDDAGNIIPLSERFNPEKNDVRYSVKDEATEKIFATAKTKFGTTYDMREAGWILPDGSMLDFSGKHEIQDADTSFLNGRRSVDHRAIQDIAYDFDENETGVKTDLGDFLDRGAIRIDYNAGSINLNVAPTKAQKDRLRRLIERNGGDVYIDFGKGWDTEHYVEYEAARPTRVLGDIDRYFDEGIKPTGNVRFSLKDDNAIDNLHKASNTIRKWVENDVRGKSFRIELPEYVTRQIRREMGRDFDSHNITANGIAHALKNHGVDGKKLTEKSIPIRKEDAELIPYIMAAPSYVRKGSTKNNRDSVRYYKTISNGYVVVIEKELDNSVDDLETINMWAELSDVSNAASTTLNRTPETTTISRSDIAKIIKDAETAIENEQKLKFSLKDTFYSNAENAVRLIKQEKATPEQWVDVTSAMRESVMQGQPLFSLKDNQKADEIAYKTRKIGRVYGVNTPMVIAVTPEDYRQGVLDTGVEEKYFDPDTSGVYLHNVGYIILNSAGIETDEDLVDTIIHEESHRLTHNYKYWQDIAGVVALIDGNRLKRFSEDIFDKKMLPMSVADEIIATFVGQTAVIQDGKGRYLLRGYISGEISIDEVISIFKGKYSQKIKENYADIIDAMLPFIRTNIETIKIQSNDKGRINGGDVLISGRGYRPSVEETAGDRGLGDRGVQSPSIGENVRHSQEVSNLEAPEQFARQSLKDNVSDADFCDDIRPTYEFNETCQGSCPEAIIAFLDSTDYESALRLAISLGGDSDTIACMTGGIAAAYYGIPDWMIEKAVKYLPDDMIDIINRFDGRELKK